VYRARPLTRVVFDRTLRMPRDARVLSTGAAGPVIIVTSSEAAALSERRHSLEMRGAEIVVSDGTMRSALGQLGGRGIAWLLLEGGARVHEAAWDAGMVDFVRLYVTPHVLGPGGVKFLNGRRFSAAALLERRTEPVGDDVMIEGYVHGPC
jgi:diaminohydroxyphosphoribosylaminopyrimidine deaminase/5-amino-6-(5-phosphoribosylamino)uracil reductase